MIRVLSVFRLLNLRASLARVVISAIRMPRIQDVW